MMKFKVLRWKNFLSTGNYFNEIDFTANPTTLIVGKNGSGKSTMLDALCFVLFGKPYRKINKPKLVNSVNSKECVVELTFSLGSKEYKVIRGIKPNIFEIYLNGVLLKQDAKITDYQDYFEKFILKMNYKSFTQIVILGSSRFVPFMQLKPADRREIIDDLLDIEIFTSMNQLLKQKVSTLKDEIKDTKYNLSLAGTNISHTKSMIDEIKNNTKEKIEEKRITISTNEQEISMLQSNIAAIQCEITGLQDKVTNLTKLEKKSTSLDQFKKQFLIKAGNIKKELKFYSDNDSCPTCLQEIDTNFKQEKLEDIEKRERELQTAILEIDTSIDNTNKTLTEVREINKKIHDRNSQILSYNTSITELNKFISTSRESIKDLESKNLETHEEETKLKDYEDEKKKLELRRDQLLDDQYYHNIIGNILKDSGIKTKVVRQYLPIINKLVNRYLLQMDFFVNFNLDENFDEVIKSRYRDEFVYESFSEGEKTRIDLAVLFTWRAIAKMKNSISTNIIIFDEILDSSLDFGGTDNFLDIIRGEESKDLNIFVISHKTDFMLDKFSANMRFEKVNGFSRIKIQ